MQCWPFSSALLQVPSHAGHLAPKGATRTAVDFKPLQLAEVCAEAQTIVLSCGRGCTLGRRTTSVNEEREQAAGQDKYLSAGHLPHLSSSPAAWLVPAPGRCHRACRYLLTPPLEPAVQGKLCSQHSVCPRDHPPQAPVGRAWLGEQGRAGVHLGRQQWPPGHRVTGMGSALPVPAPLPTCLWALLPAGAALVCCHELWVPGRLSHDWSCNK